MGRIYDPKNIRSRDFRPGAALIAGLAAWVAFAHDDYGIGWDETVQFEYGVLVRGYFASGFSDLRARSFHDLIHYGPHFDLLSVLLFGVERTAAYFRLRHLLTGLCALLAVVFSWRIAGRMRSAPALLAPVFLVFMPQFAGHAFVNSKDIPFCAAMCGALMVLARVATSARLGWGLVAAAGIAMGFVGGARPGGIPLFVLMFMTAALPLRLTFPKAIRPGLWRDLALKSGVMFIIGWGVMVLPWPHAHTNPLLVPLEAIRVSSSFFKFYPVLFEGGVHKSVELPRYYLPKFLAITTPLPILAFGILGWAVLMRRTLTRGPRRRRAVSLLVVSWFLLPVAIQFILHSNVYDGIRHFIFIFPALAICAAEGVLAATSLTPPALRRWFQIGLACAVVAPSALAIARLHPYEMTYYNALAGGTHGAAGKYELDYWTTSYREAAEWVNDRAARLPRGRKLTVMVAANAVNYACFGTYAGPRVEAFAPPDYPMDAKMPDELDLFVATTRYGLASVYPQASTVHVIGRDGAPFTIIKASDRFLHELSAAQEPSGE